MGTDYAEKRKTYPRISVVRKIRSSRVKKKEKTKKRKKKKTEEAKSLTLSVAKRQIPRWIERIENCPELLPWETGNSQDIVASYSTLCSHATQEAISSVPGVPLDRTNKTRHLDLYLKRRLGEKARPGPLPVMTVRAITYARCTGAVFV